MRRILVVTAVAVVAAGWAAGGVIVLKDGTRVEGKIRPTADGFVVTDATGKETVVAAGDVASMQPDKAGSTGAGQGGEMGPGDVAAVKRGVANLTDPKQAVERYKALLARKSAEASRVEAEKELAVWQDRVDRGLVKVGEEWVTAEQAAEKRQIAAGNAGGVASLIAAGDYAGAEKAVDGSLKNAPNDAGLLFLKGVVLFHKNQLVAARKAFEQVEAVEPGNWAAHNNLAVILWQTRAQVPAMAQYDKAMVADPGNQRVLDNVAEALHQMPPALAKNEVVRRVAVRFIEQDTLLAKKMKQEKGLVRVGAQWVPAEEYESLATSRKDAEGKIVQYQKEAATLPNEIKGIDQDMAIKVSAMKDLEMRSTVVDIFGNTQANPLPGQYYQLKQEVEQMTADRVLKQKRLEQLPRLMGEAQKQLAETQGRFTGKQVMVENLAKATGAATRPG